MGAPLLGGPLVEDRVLDRAGQRLEPLDIAAHQMAVAENKAVIHGWSEAAITGIAEASPHQGLMLGEDANRYPRPVASAVPSDTRMSS